MKEKSDIPAVATTAPVSISRIQQSWWSGLTDGQRKAINGIAIALGISVVALLAIKFGSNQIKNVIASREENISFGQDKHATWAKQLKMAFDNDGWWGTDEQAVRQTLIQIPSQEDFIKTANSYRKLYKGKNLIQDLTDELKSTEFNEMLAILQAKPKKANQTTPTSYNYDAWAKRLNSAVNYYYMGFIPGTDEAAIQAVFNEIPTQAAFAATEQAYQKLFGVALKEDLDDDLDWTMDWRAIIKKKPMQ